MNLSVTGPAAEYLSRVTACPLCGEAGPMRPRFPAYQIVECPRCALVFYAGAASTDSLYDQSYFAGGEYLDYRADRKVLQRNFRRHLPLLERWAPSGRLLELGCAYGFFLQVAAGRWQARGIDVSAEAVRHARDVGGVDAVQADFLALPDETDRYDLVCLWDTIEHLPRPIATVEKAARWLKPGGTLVLTTGDVESRLARLQGERWRQLHPPTHLFYFSAATLGRTAARAGLEPIHSSHVGHSRGYKAMLYGLFALGRKKSAWVYRLLTAGERLDFPIYLNLYDIILFAARKPAAPTAAAGAPR
jgi:SAM-dependent methyltransferase